MRLRQFVQHKPREIDATGIPNKQPPQGRSLASAGQRVSLEGLELLSSSGGRLVGPLNIETCAGKADSTLPGTRDLS